MSMPYDSKQNVLSVSLNITFLPSLTHWLGYRSYQTNWLHIPDVWKGLSDDVWKGLSDDVWKGLSDDVWKGLSDDVWKGLSDDVWKGLSDDVWKGLSDDVWKGLSDDVWKGLSDDVWKGLSDDVWKGLSDDVWKGLSDDVWKVYQTMYERVYQTMYERVYQTDGVGAVSWSGPCELSVSHVNRTHTNNSTSCWTNLIIYQSPSVNQTGPYQILIAISMCCKTWTLPHTNRKLFVFMLSEWRVATVSQPQSNAVSNCLVCIWSEIHFY